MHDVGGLLDFKQDQCPCAANGIHATKRQRFTIYKGSQIHEVAGIPVYTGDLHFISGLS